MSINQIQQSLPGERVVGLSPEDATAAATDWLRRPNLFPGRALTAPTLEQRQRWQAGRIAQRGQAFTAGVVHGFEVAHELEPDGSDIPPVRVLIEPGQGLAVSGEDIVVARRMEMLLSELPVVAPPDWFIALPQGTVPNAVKATGALQPRVIGGRLADVIGTAGARMSGIGVLVLQPATLDVASFDPNDPCDRCACGEGDNVAAFEDWRSGDAVRALWYPWPEEWRALPFTQLRQRNALAHIIFAAEAALPHAECLPWEAYGVPIALLRISDTVQISYIDRNAVARQGGRAREARLQLLNGSVAALAANSRLPALWQARIEQFAEQLAELGDPITDPTTLADPFLLLPPCGLLPTAALNLENFNSDFFPPLFALDAVPVPLEQLDLAIREAAPLAPLDIGVPERVRLLVPVSQASWEPRLLHQDVIDPEFQQTLNRFLLDRARALGARQGLRNKAALLAHAVDGQQHPVLSFDKDPLAVEPESLKPWGPPPDGGGHRSTLSAGLHRYSFLGASTKFVVNDGELLFVYVYLDPEHPPRTVLLEWHISGMDATNWQRAYLGTDLSDMGLEGQPPPLAIGPLPTAGAWTLIKVSAAALALNKKQLDGMAFTLYDGRAAFGRTGSGSRNWFSNVLPPDAALPENQPWDLLTYNDLSAPFEREDGVVLRLPESELTADGQASGVVAVPKNGASLYFPAEPGWRGYFVFNQLLVPAQVPALPTVPNFADLRITTWVFLDELDPPKSLWAIAQIAMLDANGAAKTSFQHKAFWGENRLKELDKLRPPGGLNESGGNQPLRAGALPQAGVWKRLEMPIVLNSDEKPFALVHVQNLTLLACGGTLATSDTQIINGKGVVTDVWPQRPNVSVDWLRNFKALYSRRVVLQPMVDLFAPPTASARIGSALLYTELSEDPLLARLSQHERSQLLLRGVQGFADYLRRRIDRADDITDFGFAHMQVDMARIRNMLLSTSDASRLAISPALAAIAKSESALSVQAQIKEYLTGVKAAARITTPPPPSPTTTTSSGINSVQFAQLGKTSAAKLIQAPNAPLNIVYARPVIGLSEVRTTAIAERLRQSPSTEARDFALANRHRTVSSLFELLGAFLAEDSGEVPALFQDFDIFGLDGDPFLGGAPDRKRKLIDFRNDPALLPKLLSPPPVTADEAVLFTQTVALSDNTVAILRQLEGRLAFYREALLLCERVLEGLQGNISAVAQRLTQIEAVLAEARHDVGVARALIVEEQARIDGVNARRTQVLAEEVKFLAYARPRETSSVLAAPRRVVDPALAEAPVPACLRDHHDVPDELEDMLKVVREAPAAWFITVPKLLDKLDRSDVLLRAVRSAQLRLPQIAGRPLVAAPVAGKLGSSVTHVLTRQTTLLAQRLETLNRVDFNAIAAGTWQSLRNQAQDLVSLGDIIDGEHSKGAVAREAAAEFDRIAAVCGCLHAEFCGVSAAIRLDWAELFSQFDDAPDLHNLGNLPRWAEIDSIDRRQMQAYVDYLFAQLEPKQPQGAVLINDVIRMCLLLASHAPIGRIIAGRLPRPVTGVRPGIRIPLVALEPAKLRVGMQALVYRQQNVIARAVVEDIGNGEVAAKVLFTSAAQIDLDVDVRVHFDHASVVSAAAARTTLFAR